MDLEEDFSLNLTYGLEAVSRAPSRVKAGRAERLAGRGGRGRGDSRPDGGLELRRPLSSRLREEISTGTKNEPEFEITGQVANDMMTKAEDVEPCPEKMIQERVAPSEKVVSSLHQCPQEASAPDAAQLIEEAVVTEATNEVELAPAASKVKRKRMTPTLVEDPHQFHSKPRDLGEHAGSLPADTGSSRQLASSHIFSRTPFSALPLPARLAATLERPPNEGGMNLQTSTRVQSVVVPLLHNGGNLLMKSQTGSGKTLAYLLPILSDLMGGGAVSRGDGTRALIISPTRELSVQITDTLGLLTRCCVWVVCGSVSGGEKKKSEKARLRKGVTVLVATPGRLLDHAKTTESFRLNQLRWVVLDEADRLLDMGFEQTILELLSIIRGAKLPGLKDKPGADGAVLTTLDQKWRAQAVQALKTCSNVDGLFHIMASATLTKGVRELALPVMGGSSFFFVDADAETVNTVNTAADLLAVERQRECAKRGRAGGQLVGGVVCFMDEEETAEPVESSKRSRSTGLEEGESMLAPSQLKQYYMLVSCKWRLAALVSFLRSYAHLKVVVFFSTCDSVDFHGLLFRGARWPEDLDAAHEEQNVQKKTQILDPLPHKFTGLFGDKCNMYRLHGNVPQKIRQEVYRDFCVASSGVLLCTDVAARGLDLPRVDWILQYDPPCETTDYVHRVGRTARRGLGGSALLFLLPSEKQYVSVLASHDLHPEPLSLQSLFLDAAAHIPGATKFKNTDEMSAVILQRRLERVVDENKFLLGASRQAFRSFVRAYATHSSDTKGIFKVQALHLGHAAKSFAMRESPAALRNYDDVIAKVFNGECTAAAAEEAAAERKTERRADAFKKKSRLELAQQERKRSTQKLRKKLTVNEHDHSSTK